MLFTDYRRVTFQPNESLSGDGSLEKGFTGLDAALKKSDVQLFWAYDAPEELNIPLWSGGWILQCPVTRAGSTGRCNTI